MVPGRKPRKCYALVLAIRGKDPVLPGKELLGRDVLRIQPRSLIAFRIHISDT